MNPENKQMKVEQIVIDPGKRALLYGSDPNYHVIADVPIAEMRIKVGDVITYEPYGVNFGWLVVDK